MIGGGRNASHCLTNLLLMLRPPVLEPDLDSRRVQIGLAGQSLAISRTWVAVLLEGLLEHSQLILIECGPMALLVQ